MSVYRNEESLKMVEKTVDDLMGKYHNCAQGTLVGIQKATGLKDDGLAKASTGFAGGVAGMQSVCGALIGGILALEMKYGRDYSFLEGPPEAAQQKQGEAMEQAERLAKWFEREFGTVLCKELRKKHMGTELSMGVPWQNEWADQLGMKKRCSEIAMKTARRVLAMLDDPKLNIMEKV
jgi:C_GCAxxG_C_C family probable redox protein